MEEAEYCHRLAVMNRGRIIALDRPRGMKEAIREPTLEVVTDDPPKAVEALRGVPGVLEVTLFGRVLHVMVENEAAARRGLPSILEAKGRCCHSIRVISPSLEDVFASLVRRTGGTVAG
jgi:ABC-2 type transport system ATP-binding protein